MGSNPLRLRCLLFLAPVLGACPSAALFAQEPADPPGWYWHGDNDLPGLPRRMESHMPNYIAYNVDEGYDGHVDFRFSLKYSFFKYSRPYRNARLADRIVPHAAFTARMSQFIGTQDSSPVLGRRFNPELFLRFWSPNAEDYFDLAYGHESNGQNINAGEEYRAKQDSLVADGDDIALADKFISRGWDYVGFTTRKSLFKWGEDQEPGSPATKELVLYGRVQYFLDDGFFQGKSEDYYDFEPGPATEREQFDGLSMLLRMDTGKVTGFKVTAQYITGYDGMFDRSTVRLECTAKDFGLPWSDASLPLTVWWQDGYNADLATYNRQSHSFGIGIEFE